MTIDFVTIKGMKTIIKQINSENYIENHKEDIREAGEILKAGGVVAFPTETVYGLGADALNPEAAKKIYEAKGRPSDNPLIIHIAKHEDSYHVAAEVSEKAKEVMERFWPGPLTLVLPKKDCVPHGTTGGLDTVAVRMPNHELARELIQAGGGFICAPSANVSGRPSPTKATHVIEDMDGKIDMIVACDNVSIGLESTILDMTVEPPVILRPGAITQTMLEEVIGTVNVDKATLSADSKEAPRAPGMKYRHYAPKAELTVVEGKIESRVAYINEQVEKLQGQGYKVAVMAAEETAHTYKADVVESLGQAGTEDAAVRLYDVLRGFDHIDVDYIFSEEFPTGDLGQAVMNRLKKAAGNNVVSM